MADSTEQALPQPSSLKAFWAGLLAMVPVWVGAAPFGAIYAVTALEAGFTPAQTLALSMLVFAGASQMTAVGLFANAASPFTILFSTVIVNARLLLLGASFAPHVRSAPRWQRLLLASQLTDETYAMGVRAFLAGKGSFAYQLGANMGLYAVWAISTSVGIWLGMLIPDPAAYGLDLIFPLTFIGLLVPLLRDRTTVTVAVLAAVITIGGALLLPGSWYMLIAGIIASGIGAWLSRKHAVAEKASE